MGLYLIEFFDGTIFEGGSLESPNWLDIPHKGIKKLIYFIPRGKKIICEGYEKYYHFCEACMDLMGLKSGQIQLEYTYLIGKKDKKYEIYKIDLRTRKYKKEILDKTDKFILELNPLGWR